MRGPIFDTLQMDMSNFQRIPLIKSDFEPIGVSAKKYGEHQKLRRKFLHIILWVKDAIFDHSCHESANKKRPKCDFHGLSYFFADTLDLS